jgi:hypothetical protein
MDEHDMTVPQTEADGRNCGLGWDSKEATPEAERGQRWRATPATQSGFTIGGE